MDYLRLAEKELQTWVDVTGIIPDSEDLRQEQIRLLVDILRKEAESNADEARGN